MACPHDAHDRNPRPAPHPVLRPYAGKSCKRCRGPPRKDTRLIADIFIRPQKHASMGEKLKEIRAKSEKSYHSLRRKADRNWVKLANGADSLMITYPWICVKCGGERIAFVSYPEKRPSDKNEAMLLSLNATPGACQGCMRRWTEETMKRRTSRRATPNDPTEKPVPQGKKVTASETSLVWTVLVVIALWWFFDRK